MPYTQAQLPLGVSLRRHRLTSLLILLFAFAALSRSQETSAAVTDTERQQALHLLDEGKFVAAMPLFEKLVADHPDDSVVREGWAWCLFEYSMTLPDPTEAKKVRIRSRAEAIKAQQLGDKSQILQILLSIPEDGSKSAYSDREDVDNAMRAAEADFARGDLDKAREGYLRVLVLDPNNYEATIFTGDVFFKQHVYGSAGEWFARAIQIDPNRETAYRYWGDSLRALGKDDEARSRFIDAIVAEPYSQSSWVGLTNWVQHHKLQMTLVHLKDGSSVKVKDPTHIDININPSTSRDDPNSMAWTSYGLARAVWHTEKYEKQFPDVPRNRHTLQEEAHALDFMIKVLREGKNYEKDKARLDPSLQYLIKVSDAGFIEPFVLLNRADDEIAQDYETYRRANRQKIRDYLDLFVAPRLEEKPQ